MLSLLSKTTSYFLVKPYQSIIRHGHIIVSQLSGALHHVLAPQPSRAPRRALHRREKKPHDWSDRADVEI
jgi:hypothetical protein